MYAVIFITLKNERIPDVEAPSVLGDRLLVLKDPYVHHLI